MAHPVADTTFVKAGHCADMFKCGLAGDTPTALADDQRDLAFVVELFDSGGTSTAWLCAASVSGVRRKMLG